MRTLLVIAVLLSLCTLTCNAAIATYSMWLTSHPQAIVADSHSSATITAEVRDSSGHAAPDDTVVNFTTSLGIIEREARTIAGVARVRLESGNSTGTALVSAITGDGNAVAQLRVDFLEPGTEMFDESFISVASDRHLGYDVNTKIVDSAGGVTIYHRGLTIKAEEAQIDLKTNILRAKAKMGGDPITIRLKEKSILASALWYDFNAMNGVILGPADEGAKRLAFRGRDLYTEPSTEMAKKATFDFEPVTESKLFIRAKSLTIRPGEEIKFRRANYFMEGDKVLSVPLQVVPLRGGGTGIDQMLTYGTEGLRMDLPLYYSLTPTGTGAIRLKHSEPTGWGNYSDRAGWQVDLDQDYNIAGSSAGRFSVNRISKDWGLRWNQRTELDADSQVYTYFDYPMHRDLYGTLDYSRNLQGYTWSVSMRGSKYRDRQDTYSTDTCLQSKARPLIGNAVNYAFTTKLSYSDGISNSDRRLGTRFGMQFYGKPLRFGSSTSVNTSMNVWRDWGGSSPGTRVYANTGLFRMLGNVGQCGLSYSYSWGNADGGDNTQSLSANLSMNPRSGWGTSIYATYGLNDKTISAFGDIGYTFMETWRLSYITTLQRFRSGNFSDYEISLSKLLGRQEARLTWSQSRRKFRLEFSAAQF